MASKARGKKVGLKCQECGRIHYVVYVSMPPGQPKKKLELKKYCPQTRKHAPHVNVDLK